MKSYVNPLILNGEKKNTSDPFVTYFDGFYYHIYSDLDGIYISKFKELCDIANGEITNVYPLEKKDGTDWYAPELHRIGDAWYIYVSPNYGENLHSMTVLRLKNDTPIGTYTNVGVVKGLEGRWAIDGTVFEHNDKLYYVWTFGNGTLSMQEMLSPDSLNVDSKRMLLAKAELPFETITETKIIEGPAVLKRGQKIHIIYSANDSKFDEYCLGRITYSGGDILDESNWRKHPDCIFKKTDKVFGPGHCSFTVAEDDKSKDDYIVYHANIEPNKGWQGRCVFIQKFNWNEEDEPVFGEPVFGKIE